MSENSNAPDAPIRVVVPGAIVAWKRAQRRRLGNGAVITFTDRDVEAYHATVRMAAERAMNGRPPLDGAVEMTITAVFGVPASWSRKRQAQALAGTLAKVTKPDIENSVKGAMDALQSVAYCDDRQIVKLSAQKVYGDRPRLEIVLSPRYEQFQLPS
jgi:Holliday junction resolvase RusA-like endonuclease